MRKTIIFASLAALLGFAAMAQASDQSRADMRDATQVTPAAVATDGHHAKHDREARNEHAAERHDESSEKRHHAREGHNEDEAAEHRTRR